MSDVVFFFVLSGFFFRLVRGGLFCLVRFFFSSCPFFFFFFFFFFRFFRLIRFFFSSCPGFFFVLSCVFVVLTGVVCFSSPVSSSLVSQTSSAASRGSCIPSSCCTSSWGAEPSGFLAGERCHPHLRIACRRTHLSEIWMSRILAMAVDTTLVCALDGDGRPWRGGWGGLSGRVPKFVGRCRREFDLSFLMWKLGAGSRRRQMAP